MENAKQTMIDKITDAIKDFGKEARENQTLTLNDKIDQVDVLLDTLKFLSDYDENVKVLNKYYANKRFQER